MILFAGKITKREAIMRKSLIFALFMFSLSGCSFQPTAITPDVGVTPIISEIPVQQGEPPTPTPIMPPELIGDIGVQQLMLFSHTRWQNLTAEYKVALYSADGSAEPDIQNIQIWIQLPAEFRIQTNDPDQGLTSSRISDGSSMLDSEGNRSDVPAFLFEPFNPPNYPSDTVYPHPLSGYLGTSVSDLVFPAGLAQRGGEYQITGVEMIAGREAQVVEWSRSPGTVTDRFWVDKQTGVVLRQQNYGKQQNISPLSDIQAVYIKFDENIPSETFALEQIPTPAPTSTSSKIDLATVTVLSQVVNVRSGPNTGYEVVTMVEAGTVLPVIGRNEAGDWWKVELTDQSGWVFGSFVEFSGNLDDVPITNY